MSSRVVKSSLRRSSRPFGYLQVLARQVGGHAERVHELEPHPFLFVQGLDEVVLQLLEPAAGEEGRVAVSLGAQGQPGGHGEDLRV